MKTFNETTASKFIVVRSLGLDVEIVLVPRNKVGYVASQMYYAATLAQGKPRKMFVAEFNEPMQALAGETKFNEITAWEGTSTENTYHRSSFKDIIALAEAEQITLDSVFHSAVRREFFMAFVAVDEEKIVVAKFMSARKAKSFIESYTDPLNFSIMPTVSFNEDMNREVKEIFAYFNPGEVHEIPVATMRSFTKNVLSCTK